MSKPKKAIALAFGTIVLSALLSVQTAQAILVTSGTAQLADAYGVDTGPESLTVNYSVTVSAGVYTYSYSVVNPIGDVVLSPAPGAGSPEIVDAFAVAFNTTLSGAYVPGSQTGGAGQQNNGVSGLFWSFSGVSQALPVRCYHFNQICRQCWVMRMPQTKTRLLHGLRFPLASR